jgi:adenosylhomocysteine nucleosidase
MIGIIAAMEQELAAIMAAARAEGPLTTQVLAGRPLHQGTLAGRPVVLAQSGVGKVAAAATSALLATTADTMIMVGTAGGLGDSAPGDVVVATELLQHDFDARPLWPQWVLPGVGQSRIATDPALTELLAAAAEAVCAEHRPDLANLGLEAGRAHRGLVISGDQFIGSAEASAALQAALPEALAVEMEGAAVAQVCRTAGVRFALARTVSDRADHHAALDFQAFLEQVAAPYARDLVLALLRELR